MRPCKLTTIPRLLSCRSYALFYVLLTCYYRNCVLQLRHITCCRRAAPSRRKKVDTIHTTYEYYIHHLLLVQISSSLSKPNFCTSASQRGVCVMQASIKTFIKHKHRATLILLIAQAQRSQNHATPFLTPSFSVVKTQPQSQDSKGARILS
ncbi:hypothetical protein VTO42DRAFT_4048 [Malbranchea cinnamomea]